MYQRVNMVTSGLQGKLECWVHLDKRQLLGVLN